MGACSLVRQKASRTNAFTGFNVLVLLENAKGLDSFIPLQPGRSLHVGHAVHLIHDLGKNRISAIITAEKRPIHALPKTTRA